MTTDQYFNLELGCNFTLNELYVLYDALSRASSSYFNSDQPFTANTCNDLADKIYSMINKFDSIK